MRELTENQRRILRLVDRGDEAKEIAIVLGCHQTSVYQAIRARQQIANAEYAEKLRQLHAPDQLPRALRLVSVDSRAPAPGPPLTTVQIACIRCPLCGR